MTTNIEISGHTFSCVPLLQADFADLAAIYIVLSVAQDGSWKILDVGQSGEVGIRIDDHGRRHCWERNCPSKNLWVGIHPMPSKQYTKQQRIQLESDLRREHIPPCGKR